MNSSSAYDRLIQHVVPVLIISYVLALQLSPYTFIRDLQLPTLLDFDLLVWLVATVLGLILDLLNDFVALKDLAEDDVAAVEPGGLDCGDKELGAVGVFAGVGHAHETLFGVL